MFEPGLFIGQEIKNAELVGIFQCGNMGGMRRSHATNTLVLVSDYTKGIYHDKWIGGVLHYTGMGKNGDQDIHWAQNATLAECDENGIDVHLFEVMEPGTYIYCGRIELVSKPYTETQPGEDGVDRQVWMFPVRPVPENNVSKPQMFVFKDMEDYKQRGKNVDKEYLLQMTKVKPRKNSSDGGLKGKRIKHKIYGIGIIAGMKDGIITVNFVAEGKKTLNYQICLEKKMIEMI